MEICQFPKIIFFLTIYSRNITHIVWNHAFLIILLSLKKKRKNYETMWVIFSIKHHLQWWDFKFSYVLLCLDLRQWDQAHRQTLVTNEWTRPSWTWPHRYHDTSTRTLGVVDCRSSRALPPAKIFLIEISDISVIMCRVVSDSL